MGIKPPKAKQKAEKTGSTRAATVIHQAAFTVGCKFVYNGSV